MRQRTALTIKAATLAIAMTGLFLHRAWCKDNYQYYAHKRPDPKPAYDFTLKDQDGKPFSLSSQRGKFVLMAFGFTHCPNICPTTLANLATAYELLSSEDRARVQVLFISVDPDRDTSKVLKDYVPFFNKHFIGLTGQPNQIAATAKAYGVEYEKTSQPGAVAANYYSFEHSDVVYLLGPSGKWIALYGDRQLRNSRRVADDLRHFLASSPRGDCDWQPEKTAVVKPQPVSGRQLYLEQCASCHLENGRGVSGKYPPLVGSAWVIGAPNRLTTLVVNGVQGEQHAGAARYAGVMPAWRTVLVPADTAAILTYIRQAWGNAATAISAGYVQNLTYQFASRADFWSWKELEALPPDTNAKASSH